MIVQTCTVASIYVPDGWPYVLAEITLSAAGECMATNWWKFINFSGYGAFFQPQYLATLHSMRNGIDLINSGFVFISTKTLFLNAIRSQACLRLSQFAIIG